MDYDIFISYRREGGAQYARILKAELEKRGYRGRVFLDYDELRDGKFDSRIMAAIDSARVFIFILSPGSLDRCCNADDWVRQEILYALEHEKHIIPVNFDGLFTGFPLAVPEEIRTALGQHQFSKIDSESLLDVSLDKMIRERIVPVVSMYDSDATQDVGAEITVIADADCAIFFFDKKLGTAQAGVPCKLKLKKGNYLLDFVSAQVPYISRKLKYAVPDNDYCDFIELTIKDEVDPELVELTPFENEEGKYGFKDSAGRVVIPCIYEYACDFHDGLAEVEKEDGPDGMKFTAWGYVDKRGREVIPCKFEYTRQFGDGLAWVEEFDGTAYYIDRTGKKVFDCTGSNSGDFHCGRAMVDDEEGLWGYRDRTGKIVIPCRFYFAYDFAEGMALVMTEDNKYGFIDLEGRLVIPYQYDYAENFTGGVTEVAIGDETFKIDKHGNRV